MNPKSLTIGELYGEVNLQTLEWHDGILPLSLRTAVQVNVLFKINLFGNHVKRTFYCRLFGVIWTIKQNGGERP